MIPAVGAVGSVACDDGRVVICNEGKEVNQCNEGKKVNQLCFI